MRKSRVIAFVVAALVSGASLAGAQVATPGTAAPRAQRGARRAAGEKGRHALLRGITLSDAEKAKLKDVNGKYAAERKSLRASMQPALQEARAARQKGDTAAARAAFERTKGDREKLRALMDRERSELRSALSPEHQATFDQNVKQVAERRGQKGGKGRHRRARGNANRVNGSSNG